MARACKPSPLACAGALPSAGAQNVQLFAPDLPLQWGTHHTKGFVLHYETGLRVIVHTANLRMGDCTYKTQALWYQVG